MECSEAFFPAPGACLWAQEGDLSVGKAQHNIIVPTGNYYLVFVAWTSGPPATVRVVAQWRTSSTWPTVPVLLAALSVRCVAGLAWALWRRAEFVYGMLHVHGHALEEHVRGNKLGDADLEVSSDSAAEI